MYDSTDLKKAHLLSYIKFRFTCQPQPEEQEEGRLVPRLEDKQIISSERCVIQVKDHQDYFLSFHKNLRERKGKTLCAWRARPAVRENTAEARPGVKPCTQLQITQLHLYHLYS